MDHLDVRKAPHYGRSFLDPRWPPAPRFQRPLHPPHPVDVFAREVYPPSPRDVRQPIVDISG
jgi:hypothetical protein